MTETKTKKISKKVLAPKPESADWFCEGGVFVVVIRRKEAWRRVSMTKMKEEKSTLYERTQTLQIFSLVLNKHTSKHSLKT